LVGESTRRLTRSAVGYTEGHEIEAKGEDAPVAAYEVMAIHDAEDEIVTPFVGRVEELGKLRTVLADTILERSARMVTVIGSPGVGKTRVARELRGMVAGGVLAHELRCERAGATTFAPVADLLRVVAGIADSDSVPEIQAALRSAVDGLNDAGRVADLLGGFLGVTAMRSTEEMFFAVRRLFEILGEREPVMLVVDDIQWAEPLFLDLLEHLAEWVQSVPLLIVALARPEIREARPGFSQTGRSIAAVVGLEGLDDKATGELAARLLGSDRLPAGLLDKIPESTEGNPLFVRELVRMLVDDGVISNESGSWELVIDLEAVEVPPTVTRCSPVASSVWSPKNGVCWSWPPWSAPNFLSELWPRLASSRAEPSSIAFSNGCDARSWLSRRGPISATSRSIASIMCSSVTRPIDGFSRGLGSISTLRLGNGPRTRRCRSSVNTRSRSPTTSSRHITIA